MNTTIAPAARQAIHTDYVLPGVCSREMALDAIARRDVTGLLCLTGSHMRHHLLIDNAGQLIRDGMYEKALVETWTMCPTWCVDARSWSILFSLCDRDRLRAAGDPISAGDSVTLYRGADAGQVGGTWMRPAWTTDHELACWFAARHGGLPTVWTITVPTAKVLFYTNDRNEHEYVLSPAYLANVKRLVQSIPMTRREIVATFERRERRMHPVRFTKPVDPFAECEVVA